MPKISLLLSAVCALALTSCAAQQPPPYRPPPRPQMDPLPADLRLTGLELQLCQRWLAIFSASPQIQGESCGTTSVWSNDSTPASP